MPIVLQYALFAVAVVVVSLLVVRGIRQHRLANAPAQPARSDGTRPAKPRPAPPTFQAASAGAPSLAQGEADEDAEVDEPADDEPVADMVEGTALSVKVEELFLDIDNAQVTVDHVDGLDGIHYSTNYPKHFSASKGTIAQTGSSGWKDYVLAVKVPAAFAGGLRLASRNSTTFKVDRWTGGLVFIDHASDSPSTLGDLEKIVGLHVIGDGEGNLTLGKVTGGSGFITMKGDGAVNLGPLTMEGDLAITIQGDGDATVAGSVKADSFILTQKTGNGAFKSAGIEANRTIKFDNRDDGNATTTGDLVAPNVQLICEDDATITVPNIRAEGGDVVIDTGANVVNADPQGTVNIGSITGGALRGKLLGNVDVKITGGVKLTGIFEWNYGATADSKLSAVEALNATIRMLDEGSVDLGDLKIQRRFDSTQFGSGGLTLHMVEAESFAGTMENDGGLDITGKATIAKCFTLGSYGSGGAEVAACDCDLMALESDEEGADINVKGGTARCVVITEQGEGTVTVADSFTNVHYHPARDEEDE